MESWLWNSNKLLRDTLVTTPTTMTTMPPMLAIAVSTAMSTPPPAAMAIVELLLVLGVGPDMQADVVPARQS